MGRTRSGGNTYELKARFSIESDTRGVDDLLRRLNALERKMKSLDGKKAEPSISERGGDAVEEKLDDLNKKIETIDDARAELTIREKGADDVSRKLTTLQTKASDVSRRAYDLEFRANTAQAIKEADTLGHRADAVTRQARVLRILGQAIGFDKVHGEIDKLNREANQLSRERITLTADIRGQNEVTSALADIRRRGTELTARPYEVEVQGDVASAQRAFRDLAAQARAQFSRAYKVQVEAESRGFTEAAAQADALKREMLTLSQSRANVAVALEGVSPAIAGLLTVKRAADGVEGNYTIRIDYSKIGGAIGALLGLRSAGQSTGGILSALGSHFMNASNAAGALSRAAFVTSQSMQVFLVALLAVAAASAGPLLSGLSITLGALVAFAGGLGLVAAAVAPVISALGNYKQNSEKVTTAQNAARNSANQVANAEQGLAKAYQQVSKAAQQGEQQVSSAIKAHEDAVRGIEQARRQYDQAVRGVQDAEVRGEEQIVSAIRAHEKAVQAVDDAERALGKAVEGAAQAAIDAQESIRQAVKSHEDAIRTLDDAYRDYDKAAQAVIDAEIDAQERVATAIEAHDDAIKSLAYAQEDYQIAQQDSTDAQKELTAATEDYNDALATESQRLLSLQYDLEGLAINQKQLALDLVDAQNDIATAETSMERERAALRYEELLLRQKEGVIAIDEAQRNLSEAQTEGTSELQSAYDAQQGAIDGVSDAYRNEKQAAEGITDAQEEIGSTAADISKAQIEGSRNVADAQEGLADAARGITDAQYDVAEASRAVTKAQVDGARSVRDANEGVADAQRALTNAIEEEQIALQGIGKARDEASRSISDAQERVLEAQLGIEDAMRREEEARIGIDQARQQAAEQMQSALDNVAQAERTLAEATRDNQDAVSKLSEALAAIPDDAAAIAEKAKAVWESFKAGTADARSAITGLTLDILDITAGAVPYLADATNATAAEMVSAFWRVHGAWGDYSVWTSLKDILAGFPTVTGNMSTAFGYALGGLANIFAQMMPYVERFSEKVSEIALRFLAWTDSEAGRAAIKQFFDSAYPVVSALGYWIWQIAGGLLSWSVANPQGVASVINFIGSIIWGVGAGIGAVVKALIWMNDTVPGSVAVGAAIAGIYYAIRLVPQPIRQAIGELAKFSKGMTFGQSAAAGLSTVGTKLRFLFISLTSIFSSAGGGMAGLRAVMMASVGVFGLVSAPVWVIVAAIAALAAGAYLVYQNWDWIGPWFWSLWEGIKNVAGNVWAYISDDIYAAGSAIWSFLQTQWGMIQTWWGQMMESLGFNTTLSWDSIYAAVEWAINGISSIISWFGPHVGAIFRGGWDFFVGVVSSVWSIISGIVSGALQTLGGIIMFWTGVFSGDWDLAWQGIGWIVSGAGTAITGIVEGIFGLLGNIFYAGLSALEYATGINFTAIYDTVVWALNGVWTFIKSIFQSIWMYLFGGSVIPDIYNSFVYYFGLIYNAVVAPITGIQNIISAVMNTVLNIVSLVGSGIQMSWDLVMYGVYYTAQAVWNGIWTTIDIVLNTIYAIVSTVVTGIQITWDTIMYGIMTTAEYVWNGIWSTIDVIIWGISESVGVVFWGIYDTIVLVWDYVFGDSEMTWNELWTALSGIWSGVYDELSYIFNYMWTTIVDIWNGVWTDTSNLWNEIWTFLEGVWSSIYDTISTWISDAWSYISSTWSSIYEDTSAVWNSIWTFLGDTWSGIYDTTTGWLSDLGSYMSSTWDEMWAGVDAFGGWIYDTLNSAFGDTVKTALDWLSTLLYGAADVLEYINDPGGYAGGVRSLAESLDYYADGGMKTTYMADGGHTRYMERGGVGTTDPNPQHVIWNEQHGNEAWIAERGPRQQNLNYLRHAASWLDMSVVPKGRRDKGEKKAAHDRVPRGVPRNTGGARMKDGGIVNNTTNVIYAAHGATLPWDSGITARTAEIANEIYGKWNDGNLYYNSYVGHPDGYEEREQYSVDWWSGYRGGGAPGYGDEIAAAASTYPEFSYYIWNGTDSYDGSIAAYDPHYDHVHTTFMGDIGLGGGAWGTASNWLRAAAGAMFDTLVPEMPDLGDGVVADTGEWVGDQTREAAKNWVLSFIPKGGGSGGSNAENVALGKEMAEAYGWGNDFSALEELWTRESHWNHLAENPESGAYGIPQSLPADKMASHGSDYMTSAGTQIAWGLDYIAGRYGSPSAALDFHDSNNWYAKGGITRGPHRAVVGDNKSGEEAIIPLDDHRALAMISTAINEAAPQTAITQNTVNNGYESLDNLLVAGADNSLNVGISGDSAFIGDRIDSMKEELKQSLREEMAETELGSTTMDQMIKTAVATALAVVSSRGARDIIDESLGAKFEFDREMSEL